MGAFLTQNIVSIIFGITTLITSAIALHYRRKEHRQRVEQVLEEGRKVGLFLSREGMMRYLLQMYDDAKNGDVIWAQCVRCTNFTPNVRKQILQAAGKGVKFRMILNQHSPSLGDFQALFKPIRNAEMVAGQDNTISLQGLSDREVVIAFPGVEAYTAVLVRDQYFVGIIKAWFDVRLEELKRADRIS